MYSDKCSSSVVSEDRKWFSIKIHHDAPRFPVIMSWEAVSSFISSHTVRHRVKRPENQVHLRKSAIHKIMHCYLGPIVVHFFSTCDCLGFYTWTHRSLGVNFVHRHIGKLVYIVLFVVFLNLRRWFFLPTKFIEPCSNVRLFLVICLRCRTVST